jgi:hypothetical protein
MAQASMFLQPARRSSGKLAAVVRLTCSASKKMLETGDRAARFCSSCAVGFPALRRIRRWIVQLARQPEQIT